MIPKLLLTANCPGTLQKSAAGNSLDDKGAPESFKKEARWTPCLRIKRLVASPLNTTGTFAPFH